MPERIQKPIEPAPWGPKKGDGDGPRSPDISRPDTKDLLKARNYSWDMGTPERPKAWQKEIAEDALEGELAWLRDTIYRGKGAPETRKLTARTRYSAVR